MKPIGKVSIRAMVEQIKPKRMKLFPRAKYPTTESVRARCSEIMQQTEARFVTACEPEGVYVIRLR